jgi:CheY-like chemotaxis protein
MTEKERTLGFTQTNDGTKLSAQILKQVDQLVKSNDLERALVEVKKARELDPKNLYAFAYEERIQELFSKRQVQRVIDPSSLAAPSIHEASPVYPVSSAFSPPPDTDIYGVKVPTLYEEFKKIGRQGIDQTDKSPQQIPNATKEALETYKQALLLIWSDGQKTKEEKDELLDLRNSLLISEKEHDTLERQAKLECYILLLKHVLQSSASKTEVEASLAELRGNFDVSTSDHMHIETNLAALKEKEKQKTIMVVDDDKRVLSITAEILSLAQYAVKAYTTSDEAYDSLKKENADLILCDINLETSTMNGFVFYERVRETPQLKQLPFIFITGLNDALLIRTAKEMGVDDFLIKPIRRENLLATIHGRLKRYEEMKILAGMK